jgi:GH43 family beta-xylosidase
LSELSDIPFLFGAVLFYNFLIFFTYCQNFAETNLGKKDVLQTFARDFQEIRKRARDREQRIEQRQMRRWGARNLGDFEQKRNEP